MNLKYLTIIFFILLASPAFAQQQSSEQLYRQINSALAQDNARLGAEKENFEAQIKALISASEKAQARIKELESKQEEKK